MLAPLLSRFAALAQVTVARSQVTTLCVCVRVCMLCVVCIDWPTAQRAGRVSAVSLPRRADSEVSQSAAVAAHCAVSSFCVSSASPPTPSNWWHGTTLCALHRPYNEVSLLLSVRGCKREVCLRAVHCHGVMVLSYAPMRPHHG